MSWRGDSGSAAQIRAAMGKRIVEVIIYNYCMNIAMKAIKLDLLYMKILASVCSPVVDI